MLFHVPVGQMLYWGPCGPCAIIILDDASKAKEESQGWLLAVTPVELPFNDLVVVTIPQCLVFRLVEALKIGRFE